VIRRALTAVGLGLLAVIPASVARADGLQPDPTVEDEDSIQRTMDADVVTAGQLIQNPRIFHAAVLDGIEVAPEDLGGTGDALAQLRQDIAYQEGQLAWSVRETEVRTETLATTQFAEASRRAQLASAVLERQSADAELLTLSVEAFVNGTDQPDISGLLQATSNSASTQATQSLRNHRIAEAASTRHTEYRNDAVATEADHQRLLTDAIQRVSREQRLLETAETVGVDAEIALNDLVPRIPAAEWRLEEALISSRLPGTDHLDMVAVDAYYNASLLAYQRWPACRVAWHQLAGVGRVESFHGNFGSSTIDRNGQTAPRILGPQLNGDPWLAIPDSDGGELDGDLEWDRAVGPMQFIPTSWSIFAADGNGDGVEDPHNLYDAALAAADHLCGSGLDDAGRFRTALLGYNRSTRYGSDVIRFSEAYRALADITNPWEVAATAEG